MHSATQILSSIKEEINIIKHLYGKIRPGEMSFSPGEKMRTVDELLRYISYLGISIADWHKRTIEGKDSKGLFQKYVEEAKAADLANFPKIMDEQYEKIAAILSTYTENDLKNKQCKTFTGGEVPLGEVTINTILKYFTAYKMQLFLYIKQAGQSELDTYNCWAGMDRPPPKE